MTNIRKLIKSNDSLAKSLAAVYTFFGRNRKRIKGKGNEVRFGAAFVKKSRVIICGNNNRILLEEGAFSKMEGLKIVIHGNDNLVTIGKGASIKGLGICMENDRNEVRCGSSFKVSGLTQLAAIEGTSIVFGDDCLLSANITVRTGDSHSIIDNQTKLRINRSSSVRIGDHVWIGNTVLIFKGTCIGDRSVVAGGAVLAGKTFASNVIVGGNPAKVIKEGIDWREDRIICGNS